MPLGTAPYTSYYVFGIPESVGRRYTGAGAVSGLVHGAVAGSFHGQSCTELVSSDQFHCRLSSHTAVNPYNLATPLRTPKESSFGRPLPTELTLEYSWDLFLSYTSEQ